MDHLKSDTDLKAGSLIPRPAQLPVAISTASDGKLGGPLLLVLQVMESWAGLCY